MNRIRPWIGRVVHAVGDRVDPPEVEAADPVVHDEPELLAITVSLLNSDAAARAIVADKLAAVLSTIDGGEQP